MRKLLNGKIVEMTADEITAFNNQKVLDDAEKETIKQAQINAINKKASAKQKLIDLGLTEEEVKALIGV